MKMQSNEVPEWCTIFRTAADHVDWLYGELKEGRLRQGWGTSGFALLTDDQRVDKEEWAAAYESEWGERPSPQRFAILSRMLEIKCGDIVIVPKMPEWNQFTVGRVSGDYRFEVSDVHPDDFGHIVPVDPGSLRTFDYQADDEAFLVSGLFSRANHRSAISFCYGAEHMDAAHKLLEQQSNLEAGDSIELSQAPLDNAFKAAARDLSDQVATWNGHRFEEAVRQAFRDQGYEVKVHRHYDGQGGDADILVSPPARHRLFQPDEIAVQVKCKQGIDEHDKEAVEQIVNWADSQASSAVKYVISSASGFTDDARKRADDKDVVLIGGLQTMCFLLGIPERYRSDWERLETPKEVI